MGNEYGYDFHELVNTTKTLNHTSYIEYINDNVTSTK